MQIKVAWNLKGGGISGFSNSEEELKVLHDVYSASVQTGAIPLGGTSHQVFT